jgi:parallel beta-helix repeat protein
MMKRIFAETILVLLLTGILALACNIQPVRSDWTWTETIYVRADGSVYPDHAPISSADNVTYTLIDNIVGNVPEDSSAIIIERNNIVVDGAGYTVESTEATGGKGIYLSGLSNVTIQNTNIKHFYNGIYLYECSNNNIFKNNITNNGSGVSLFSSSNNNRIQGNMITNNSWGGILLSGSSSNSIQANNVANNGFGIQLYYSSNYNSISGNAFINDGLVVWSSYGNLVWNNTVNGKPLIYLEGLLDLTVGDAGQVVLVNCNRIVVENLNISNTDIGIQLSNTNNTKISGNNITNNRGGIGLERSSNNTISGNNFSLCGTAVNLYLSSYNIISGNHITDNGHSLYLQESFYNIVSGNNITNSTGGWWDGVFLQLSFNNIIARNHITDNLYGVYLSESSNNTISENNVANNEFGIWLHAASNSILRGNRLDGNRFGFGVWGREPYDWTLSDVIHDVDTSNTIDGKPIYYLINQHNITINPLTHQRVGFLALVNSTNITIENLTLAKNMHGLLMAYTKNSKIQNNKITNNHRGVGLYHSSNNIMSGNNITNNDWEGVHLYSSSNNTIFGNNIKYHQRGVSIWYSSNNMFYHNNFISNAYQVYFTPLHTNTWDNNYPSGGNYWSDYTGVDTDNDGIGDEPHTIDTNNTDRYPLVGPFNVFDAGVWDGTAYNVDVVSNSTVSEFQFNPSEGALLRFNVTGDDGTSGFCRVTIPKDLLRVEDGWTIFVGGEPITNYTIIPDENYTYLYFTYNHSTKTVEIQGTHVIPEFPSAIIQPLFMALSIIAIVFAKRKIPRRGRKR